MTVDEANLQGLALVTAPDAAALAERLASDVAKALRDAIAARGSASLVVSGGSTPQPMFAALAAHDEVDWASLSVTLADERAVAPDHEASNERLVREHLLQGPACAARFVALFEPELAREAAGEDRHAIAIARVEAALRAMPRPFDVVLLGMGNDGHTASLFPDAAGLEAALAVDSPREIVRLTPPSQALPRVSMTARALLDARRLWLHVTGEPKWQLLHQALDEGVLPIARVLCAGADLERAVYWAP